MRLHSSTSINLWCLHIAQAISALRGRQTSYRLAPKLHLT